MIFTPTPLRGAFIVELERLEDSRGFFARTWCAREFEAHGLNPRLAQCSVSFNKNRGTLRGLHYKAGPHAESKLVRCTSGSIYDVILDLRRDSPTFKHHVSVILSAESRRALYVPEGVAHGFQTLEDDTEVFYQMSEFYAPESVVRWDDPEIAIPWPIPDPILSERDRQAPCFG